MKPIVFDNIPFELSAESIAPQLHVETGTEDYEALQALVRQAVALARPKAMYTASYVTGRGEDFVELDGVRMQSRVMAANFMGLHRVFPFVMTCGEEAGEWASGITDMLQAWWADAIMVRMLAAATQRLHAHLSEGLRLGGVSSMNPGSLPDWPITEQTKLFAMLGDVRAAIGVRLTDSMLMIPAKSVSGIYFQTESGYANCQLCARENCPDRRKPFDQQSFDKMLP